MEKRKWIRFLADVFEPPSAEESRRESESLGRLLVDLGLASAPEVDACLEAQRSATAERRELPKLLDLLVQRGVLTREQLARSVVAQVASNPDNRYGRFLRVFPLFNRGVCESWKAWAFDRKSWAVLKFPRFSRPEAVEPLKAAVGRAFPLIAQILDVGEERGDLYVAAEFVEGRTLAVYPRADREPLVRLVRDAALALAPAHESGLAHGALRPSTVVVDPVGRVLLVDFALSETPGTVAGDVRALGEILYEVLCDRPAPATGARWPDWPDRVEPPLRAILAKCLADEPGARYPDAAAVAAELTRFLEGRPVEAARRSLLSRLRIFPERKPGPRR